MNTTETETGVCCSVTYMHMVRVELRVAKSMYEYLFRRSGSRHTYDWFSKTLWNNIIAVEEKWRERGANTGYPHG